MLTGSGLAAAQTSSASAPSGKTETRSTQPSRKTAPTKKKPSATTVRRVHRLTRAFIASADLAPMARQLLESRSPAAYAGVEAYAHKHPVDDAGVLAWLAIGYARVLDHEYPKAIDALKRAQPRAGDLREYVDYDLAMSYAAGGNQSAVILTLHDFDTKYPESVFLRDASLLYGAALTASARSGDAVRVLERYRNPARPDFEMALGRAYLKIGNYNKAAEAWRRIYYAYPLSAEAGDARSELDRLAAQTSVPSANFAERKTRADLLAQARRSADAAREYRALLNEAAPGNRIGIQVALGIALHASGNDREARPLLEGLPEAYDESSSRRWLALAEMARSANDEDRFRDAIAQLRRTGSTSESLEQALLLGGNMYLLRSDYDKAIDYYRELQQRFPNGKRAAYAHWKAAWLTLRQRRKDDAKREFEKHVSLYGTSPEVAAALYWRARLAEEDGDSGRARAWYEKLTYRFRQYYYAELARWRLRNLAGVASVRDPLLDAIPALGAGMNLAGEASTPPADSLRYQKSLLLHNGGMTDLAVKELRAAAPEGTVWTTVQIARYYQEDGLSYRALQTLKRAVPSYSALEIDALPRPYWETLFPRPYWPTLKKYAQENELDPFLVASLIRQESEFNPGAVSRSDALGLMQLLPKTGQKVAREMRVSGFSTNQLLTPTFNMQLGTRYFRQLMDHFGGQLEYALAAYNAGPDRVQGWLAAGASYGPDEFVESIPFTETREYVQAILRNAAIYKRLYGTP
jgi:soluble lytic murein transglycosylase